MKKNTKTYILLAVVAIIWGTIGYRVISSLSSEPQAVSTPITSDFKPLPTKEKDTFSIVADYRDPFLGTIPKKKVRKAKPKAPKPTLPEVQIQFTGFVTDRDTGKKIFFVSINGQQHLMNAKDEIEKVKLLSGTSTSIKIRHNGKVKTIQLKE